MHASHGGSAAGQQVELSFSATGLKNKDLKTKSDPVLYVYTASHHGGKGKTKWEVYEKTEIVQDNLNPKWTKTVTMPYDPSNPTHLKLKIFDGDKHDKQKLGTVKNVDLKTLMTAPSATLSRAVILKNHQHGSLSVSAATKDASEGHLEVDARAQYLKKMDRGSKTDGFLKISRLQGSTWVLVHQTEVVENSLEPHWKTFKIPVSKLHSADGHSKLLVECFDEDKGARGRSEQYIGEFETSLDELKSRPELIKDLKQVKTHKKEGAGEIVLRCKLHGGHGAAHGAAPHGFAPPQHGQPPQGYPPQGYPPQGYPPQGYPPQGYPPQGYPPQGYPPQGYPPQGYPPQGYPPQGYPGYPPPQGALPGHGAPPPQHH